MKPFTKAHRKAVYNLFKRSVDGSTSYREFSKRVPHQIGGFVGLWWCRMFVGIEPDGYTHT